MLGVRVVVSVKDTFIVDNSVPNCNVDADADAPAAGEPPPLSAIATPRETFLALLARDLWPMAVYPFGWIHPDPKKGGKPKLGKEPIGPAWGLTRWGRTQWDSASRFAKGAGIGLCLGPGRGPGGSWLGDLEGDGPEAAESLTRLFGGKVGDTMGWGSARGPHRLYAFDADRLKAILPGLADYESEDTINPASTTCRSSLGWRFGWAVTSPTGW
jgi:hypothetical protein